jgi:hypothetical protein
VDDLDLLKLINLFENKLSSAGASPAGLPMFFWPSAAPDFSRELLAAVRSPQPRAEKLEVLKNILQSQFGGLAGAAIWNPFFVMSYYNDMSRLNVFCSSLNAEDRASLVLMCAEMRSNALSRIIEGAITAVGHQPLDALARRLDSLLGLSSARTKDAMVIVIERQIARSLSLSERRWLDPILSEIGGWHHRQFS